MKQVLSVLLAAALLLALAGCTVMEKRDALKLHEGVLDSEFTGLTLDLDVADITVMPGDGFHVEYGLCNEPEIATANDGTLTIREKAADHWWDNIHFTQNIQPYVKVTVPEGTALNLLDVTVDVGDAEVSGQALGALHVDADVGNLTLQSLTVQGPVRIEADTGDITFDGSAAGIKAEADVGNVTLRLPGTAADWTMELETDVGTVMVDGADQGNRFVSRGGQYQLEAETDTGDVTVEFH